VTPHRRRNLWLGHAAFAQQDHLIALTRRSLRPLLQSALEPPYLSFVALDRPVPPAESDGHSESCQLPYGEAFPSRVIVTKKFSIQRVTEPV
jgi:hypothetical protein